MSNTTRRLCERATHGQLRANPDVQHLLLTHDMSQTQAKTNAQVKVLRDPQSLADLIELLRRHRGYKWIKLDEANLSRLVKGLPPYLIVIKYETSNLSKVDI